MTVPKFTGEVTGRPPREFEIEAERLHFQTQEMIKKDKIHQEEMREIFTKNPHYHLMKMTDIETEALGFQRNENGQLLKGNGERATEADEERLQKRIERVMLSNNPLFDEYDVQYKDGFIYPVDWRVMKHKEREKVTRGSNL